MYIYICLSPLGPTKCRAWGGLWPHIYIYIYKSTTYNIYQLVQMGVWLINSIQTKQNLDLDNHSKSIFGKNIAMMQCSSENPITTFLSAELQPLKLVLKRKFDRNPWIQPRKLVCPTKVGASTLGKAYLWKPEKNFPWTGKTFNETLSKQKNTPKDSLGLFSLQNWI